MKTFFTTALLLITMGLAAQSYNNEWIDFSKTYYKFKVGSNGLYRIPQSVLAGAGMSGVPVQNFQLFRNGQEVPIYTSVASGVLGSNDYIEFWGRMNDGAPDQVLYRSPTYQHTQKWSLETDTAVYFLTVNPTGSTFHFTNTTNDTTSTTLAVEPYFMYKAGSYFKNNINPGFAQVVGEYIYSSSYDLGEFWSTDLIYTGTPYSDVQNNLFVYSSGPDATLSFGAMGAADYNRSMRVLLNGTTMIDTPVVSFNDMNTTKPVPISMLSSNSINVQFADNSATAEDRIVASYYELNYPRQFNFGGQSNFSFELPAKSAGYFLKITNLAIVGGNTPVLYDLTSGARYTAIVGPGSTLSFLLGGSSFNRRLALVNEDPASVNTVTTLTPRTFTNFASTVNQGNYIIISNPQLYVGTNGNNPVVDYRNYRSSPAGGSFNAHIYDIDELVDQFAFGIKKHPISVHNFLRYARAVFTGKPQYVLLIGHGMTYVDYNKYADGPAHDPLADKLNIIPTFGYPASDNKLSAANVLDAVPVTPIGRISVVSGAELEPYLDKVKQYELTQITAPNTIDGRLWMKNVLHLTGVSEPFLGTILCNYMYSYKAIISDSLYGANVFTLCDGNAGSVNQVPGGLISHLFSDGFSMLNYFGHSSNTELGYNLDDPSAYNNPGKYPVFYLNGCDAGDFFIYDAYRFATSKTLSESYVLAKDRGAAAVIASTHFGIVNYLNLLLYALYNLVDQADYGKTIGVIQKDALQALVNVAPGDYFARLHAEEMTTHGDPYLRLNQAGLPDYDVEASQVLINPSFISIADNSFTMKARFFNLGRSIDDSISILVTRKFPDGSTATVIKKRIPGIAYSDSIQLTFPIVPTRDKGQNYITVTVNSDNDVVETTLANNSVNTSVYIYEDEANPIYPYNYAIINTPTQKLYASTADPFSPSSQYVMEIDTAALFSSTGKVTKNLTAPGGILEFDPGFSYQDSTVYYWRVAKVPPAGGVYKWNDFSFVYIDPTRSVGGSNQSHFYQHTQSTLQGLVLDSTSRKFSFDMIGNGLTAKTGVFPSAASQGQDISLIINGDGSLIQSVCGVSELLLIVFSPYTFHPWYNAPTGQTGRYGSINPCGPTREHYFIYDMNSATSRGAMMSFLDSIPDNYYVVLLSCVGNPGSGFANTYASTWEGDTSFLGSGNSIYHRLLNQGFTTIDSFNQAKAFIFAYQKNNPGNFTPRAIFSNGIGDKISLPLTYSTPDTLGTVTSPVFGPAKKWKELHWRGQSLESPTADQYSVLVNGVDTSGNQTLLYTVPSTTQDLDISSVSASQYPYIQLKLSVSDTAKGTPFQLKYWRLTYDPVPEGALAPNIALSVKDTLQVGEPLNFSIAFKNVSPVAFDSMTLKMTVTDKGNVAHVITLPKKKPLISGDTLIVSYSLDTKAYGGQNTLFLDVNPNNNQPEQYHFNNFLYKSFYVISESRNPVLDVTFDNIHILNEDIVSAKPHILIKLQSQSKYALLTDTSLIKVQIRFPDGSLHSYNFNSDTMRFIPATTGSDNVATVELNPAFLTQYKESGDEYELIASGKDQFGNTTGTAPYRVKFKIITKPMISNLLNYPNPFTTSTAFVFTITGSDVPQNIKIQILTITGKIVREITKDELGPLHVGRNITEFKWNGTDEYGQRLANGVYLYHVVTNLNGKSLDKYKAAGDNTDKYFNNGYGKMYLMR